MSALHLLPGRFVVCRLAAEDAVPAWASGNSFLSITRTADELSIVCAEELVPDGVQSNRGWRIFRVTGPLDFSLTGILAGIATPLAVAGVSIFALSTFDTDYVMLKADKIDQAIEALRGAGHSVG